jgi:putative phage-type endonuclease
MDREQLLLERKIGLGGTDTSAIMGLNPWKTPLDVYYEKIGEANNYDNQTLQRGRRAEKYILEEYSEHTGETLETDLPMLQDALYPFLIGHADAKVKGQNVIVEAKSTRFNISTWKGVIPEHYLCQIAHYASISNAERVDLAVLFNNWEYACFTYYRNEELEERIRKAAIDFWHNHVLPQIPPNAQSPKEALGEYPYSNPLKIIEADIDIIKKVEELATTANKINELKKKEEDIKTQIMEYMRDAERLNTPIGYSINWKSYSQNRVDVNRLKTTYPEIYVECLKEAQFRPLKIMRNNNDIENAFNL